eukprot:CAMPEP_0117009798 /NCGR_PEP_ID=MMETSP0472-20121206/8797_1 /TAXON_ID=693140 ORGANISM="Tiarina fusus, Strain LIS" /NCGR_SAMPLE_ID=MMETSP0472 /ASSEMBLY_ACC=CAM_ASM_000603 /LENGTH=216 /DNA_ID=CAMNT_0004712165 /DNA_START=75 /DNA_END=725 /DNA_ORIENTATION=+
MISQTSTSLIRATAKQSRNVTARRLNTNNATTTRESFAFYPANTRTVPKDIAASVKNGNQSFSFYPANGVSQRIPRSQASAAPKQVREQVVQQQQQQQTSSYSKTELDALFAQSRAVAQKRPQQKVTESSINESFAFYPTKQGVVANTSTKSSDSFAFYGSTQENGLPTRKYKILPHRLKVKVRARATITTRLLLLWGPSSWGPWYRGEEVSRVPK